MVARDERGTNDETCVDAVLARVVEKTCDDDLDGRASAIGDALAEREAGYQRSLVALLEEEVKVDTLRRDPVAVARRIDVIVAVDHPTDRPAWHPEFRARYNEVEADSRTVLGKGSTSPLGRHRTCAADGSHGLRCRRARLRSELPRNALATLGERESGTAWLEAVAASRPALEG